MFLIFKKLLLSVCFLLLSVETILAEVYAFDPDRVVTEKIKRFIRTHVFCDSLDLSLKMDDVYSINILQENGVEVFIDWGKNDENLAGKVLIPLRFKTSEQDCYPGHVTAWIRKFDRVGVANKLLTRNRVVTADDITFETREVTSIKRSIFKKYHDLIGKRLKRTVGKGRIITGDMVESQPVIKKGDRVDIMLVNKNLTLILTGIAKEDGWIGDRIRIWKINDRNELKGCVKSAGVVEIY